MVHGGCWDRLGHKDIEGKLKSFHGSRSPRADSSVTHRVTLMPVTRTRSHRRDQSCPAGPSPAIVGRISTGRRRIHSLAGLRQGHRCWEVCRRQSGGGSTDSAASHSFISCCRGKML